MRHTGGVTASLLVQLPQLIEQGRAVAAAALAEARETRATRETSESRETRAASANRSVEPNLVYRGDNLAALASLVATAEIEPAARAKLVYLDPPYDSGTDYRNRIETSIDGNTVALTQLAYRDRWLEGTAGYLRMLIPRLVLARELLCVMMARSLCILIGTPPIWCASCLMNCLVAKFCESARVGLPQRRSFTHQFGAAQT